MFNELKNQIVNEDASLITSTFLSESVEGGAPEDEMLEDIIIPAEEEAKIKALISKIPDDPLVSSDSDKDGISDANMAKALNDIPDPSLDELIGDEDI